MACYNPNLIRTRLDASTGQLVSVFLGPAAHTDPNTYGSLDALLKGEINEFYQTVPCQQCVGCRIDYSKEWSARICIELESCPKASFITLTYRNSDLPLSPDGNPTLNKRDIQLFFKRLRKAYPDRSIRYYLSGEYGTRTMRPHYHFICFGVSVEEWKGLVLRDYNYLKQPLYSSSQLESIWTHGNVRVGQVTSRSAAYTARYINKKQYGSEDRDLGDRVPPFTLCSRRPGIGMQSAEKMVASGHLRFTVQGRDEPIQVQMPRAFIRYCKSHDILLDKVADMQYTKAELGRERMLTQLKVSGLTFADWLNSQENRLLSNLRKLPKRSDLN